MGFFDCSYSKEEGFTPPDSINCSGPKKLQEIPLMVWVNLKSTGRFSPIINIILFILLVWLNNGSSISAWRTLKLPTGI